MALRRANTTPTTDNSKFEDVDPDVMSVEAVENSVPATKEQTEQVQQILKGDAEVKQESVSREVAPAPKREVASPADISGFTKKVEEMFNCLDTRYGNFPTYKAKPGGRIECVTDDNMPGMGRWAKVTMMSWGKHWEIGPGVSDESATDYVAFSDNGKTIDRVLGDELQSHVGSDIQEYIKYLKDKEGFDNAGYREFVDVACYVHDNEAGEDFTGKIVMFSLPPTSASAFHRYQQQLAGLARAAKMGIPGVSAPENPFTFYFITESAKKGKQEWTKLIIESKLPNKF